MTIVFYSIVLNHHQVPIADCLWDLTDHNYYFVELSDIGDNKGDLSNYSRKPYLLQSWKNKENYDKAMALAKTADVCIFSGIESIPFEKERLKLGLLSFEMGERWLKQGLINLFSPRLIKWIYNFYVNNWRRKPLYKLCCSAFCANDHYKLMTFQNKCYKWGYFTQTSNYDISSLIEKKKQNKTIRIMWCSRFIKCKHPELAVNIADRLRNAGYEFILDMYGSGKYEDYYKNLVNNLNLENYVIFHGSVPNSTIIKAMQGAQIFLFTSDKNEGWGAVANESMANGCALIASNAIGSTPYLIQDNITGCIFKSENPESLYNKVKFLIDNPSKMLEIQVNAINEINNIWSPINAAKSLLHLIENIKNGKESDITEGPCSKALPLYI